MKRLFDRALPLLAGLALLLDAIALLDFLRHPLAGEYNFASSLFRAANLLLFIPLTLLVAFLIVRRVPGNVVGPLLVVWTGSLASNSLRAAIHPILFALFYAHDMVFGWLALFLMILHFPDGRIQPPAAARWVYRLLPLMVLCAGLIMLATTPLQTPARPPNPFIVPALLPLGGLASALALLSMSVIMTLAVAAPVWRYRRGGLQERLQIKWLALFAGFLVAYSAGFLIVYRLLTGGEMMVPGNSLAALVFYLLVGLFPPLAIGVAVLRYRLWDIDLLIRRTLIYTCLTLALSAIYFTSVVALQTVFTLLTGQASSVAVVISTLGIAALFTPLRRRIQTAIDRRFYRRKVNAEQVLSAYRASLRSQVDQDQVVQSTLSVIEECLAPTHLSLWVREGGQSKGKNTG